MNLCSPTMSNDSQKRQELKRQIANRAQIADIKIVEKVASVLNSPKKWEIVERIERATTFPNDKAVESRRFIICFDYFNWKTCQLEQFNPAKGRKLLEILEQVAKCEINKFPTLKLTRDSVTNVSPYQSLFAKVSPEVTRIDETEFCEGRLFFFITEPHFNLVSVETKHRNIDK